MDWIFDYGPIILGGIMIACVVVGAVSLAVLLFKAAFFNKRR